MPFPWISVGGNSGIYQNSGREIHLESHRKRFSWISVGGDSETCWNGGREIHLESHRKRFPWISVGGTLEYTRTVGGKST